MLKEHPKGLLGAALSNMGERFGFYTMMAILVLFLQAKFGLSGTHAGIIYSVFYFSIYALAFVGGLIADKSRKYKSTILVGLIIMAIGYVMLGFPTPTPTPNKILFLIISCFGLLTIAFGNGLFKGNLQALVGQMYDNNEYSHKRDAGFSLFYMFINVGALFAPFTAIGIRNWWLARHSYEYDANLPALCHQHVENTLESTKVFGTGVLDQAQGLAEKVFGLDPVSKFQNLATEVGGQTENLTSFANDYLNVFTSGFHYAFIAAIGAMIVSLAIFLFNKKHFPNVDKKVAATAASQDTEIKMDAKEIKQRLYALLAVFGVVIFFWFSFHQNGLTLTMFARDYTDLSGIKINLGDVTIPEE
jgi:POT family proton-dependent oligopeptide transporter